MQADVSDPEAAQQLVQEAGDLDILVNNAGLTRDGLLMRMSDEDWETVIQTRRDASWRRQATSTCS